jgi:hypothetical protein
MPVENQTAPNATPDLQGVPGRPCRLCSAPLVMLPSIASGKTVPIDARAPVYVIFRDAHNKRWVRPAKDMLWELQHATPEVAAALLQGVDGFRCSHFSTCRSPDSFNAKHKAERAAREVHRLRLVEACEAAAGWIAAKALDAEDADLMRQALLAAAQNREPGEE